MPQIWIVEYKTGLSRRSTWRPLLISHASTTKKDAEDDMEHIAEISGGEYMGGDLRIAKYARCK